MKRDSGFQTLALHDWRQFASVELDFADRLTVITGANGAGKTTILTLLTQHFGWQAQFLSEPRLEKTGGLRFLSGLRRRLREMREPPDPGQQQIGELTYADGTTALAVLPEEPGSAVFTVNFQPIQAVAGVYVPSNRPDSAYQGHPDSDGHRVGRSTH